MPGLDSFATMEKSQRIRNFLEVMAKTKINKNTGIEKRNIVNVMFLFFFFQSLIVGDVIYAQVMGKSAAGLLLKILCNCSDCPRVVADLGVKVKKTRNVRLKKKYKKTILK